MTEFLLCGTSVMSIPYGAILAAASVDREELIQAEISGTSSSPFEAEWRIGHRRPELY